jgi:hypothetical protein
MGQMKDMNTTTEDTTVESLIPSLQTRSDFVKFLQQLQHDFTVNNPQWENTTLDDFLEALSRYAEDIDGYYRNLHIPVDPEQPSWRLFADMLLGARIYE